MVWCPLRGWGRKMVGVGSATEYVECQAASENSRQDCTTAVLIFKMANDADRHNGFCWFGTAIGHRRQTARYKVFRACGSPAVLHCQKWVPIQTCISSINLWWSSLIFCIKVFFFIKDLILIPFLRTQNCTSRIHNSSYRIPI